MQPSAVPMSSPFFSRFLTTCTYYYHDVWQVYGDARVAHYLFFDGGPWSALAVVAAYLYFIKALGPELMKGRKPFNLRNIILIYNATMVIVNAWLFVEGMLLLNFGLDTWGCQTVDYSRQTDWAELRKLLMGWLFFLTKFVEFADTVFFILRKKTSQVTALHVIHHSLVPCLVWVGFKFVPGGANAFFPLINSFIHILMYTYYALSIFGPQMAPYLWWKKYLTRLQMVQFVAIIVNSMRLLFMPHCRFPKPFTYLTIFNGLLFLVLFAGFYKNSYLRSPGTREQTTQTTTSAVAVAAGGEKAKST